MKKMDTFSSEVRNAKFSMKQNEPWRGFAGKSALHTFESAADYLALKQEGEPSKDGFVGELPR